MKWQTIHLVIQVLTMLIIMPFGVLAIQTCSTWTTCSGCTGSGSCQWCSVDNACIPTNITACKNNRLPLVQCSCNAAGDCRSCLNLKPFGGCYWCFDNTNCNEASDPLCTNESNLSCDFPGAFKLAVIAIVAIAIGGIVFCGCIIAIIAYAIVKQRRRTTYVQYYYSSQQTGYPTYYQTPNYAAPPGQIPQQNQDNYRTM